MQVTVEPEALAEWSARARRTRSTLDARLAALDAGLAPLTRAWHGAAAEGFAARHRQWRDAAAGLLATLAELADAVDTARANYRAADSANARIWRGRAPSGAVVVHAMSAGDGRGRGRGRIEADLEDIRATVHHLAATAADLVDAWTALAAGLAGSAAMAGGDEAGAAFAADYDAMAGAAWQGWRSSAQMLDGIAGGLAATGNNLAAAEAASTAGRRRPFTPITVSPAAAPAPAAPPSGGGAGGGPVAEHLAAYWPTADPARLRTAAVAWRASAAGLHAAVARALAAVDTLVAASPDLVLQQMRRFTGEALSDDPTSGLVGVLAGTGGRIASACEGLADLTEHTRERIRATVDHRLSGEEWYHPVADVLDRFLKLRPGQVLAAAGDAHLLDLDLSRIHDEHVRAVASVRGDLHPAGTDRLARIATAMAPPTPEPAGTCMLASPPGVVGAPVPEAQRQALIAEVVAAGHRISPPDVVQIARAPDGRVVWLERGDDRTGLRHVLRARRIDDFVREGVAPRDIPGLAIRAVVQGTPVGRVGDDATAYEVDIGGGRRRTIAVVEGSNGYVVSAYPVGPKRIRRTRR